MLPYAPWLVWGLPIIGALLSPVLAKISHKLRDYAEVAFAFAAAVMAASLIEDALRGFVAINGHAYPLPFDWKAPWFTAPGFPIHVGVLLDPLSIFMANVVAWISFLIMVYSLEYMHGDPGITRYWFFMNLFIGNMLLLVLADNLLVMFIGWEGVGLCSYALIGFWYRDEKKYWIDSYSPSHCGLKAFIVTRLGDVGMLAAMLMVFAYAGTFNFLELQQDFTWLVNMLRDGVFLVTFIMFFLGPIGKSAQFPLDVWLPEAMAGPTTVSALIHAATMVKAGVYFMARIIPILYAAYLALGHLVLNDLVQFFTVVAWIGAFTAFLTATMGAAADQMKKVLAYSTISQLGYMMAALGAAGIVIAHFHEFVYGYMSGVSHLLSHAIFKALLFLSAGAIGHAIESYMLKDMGGLKKYMPITYMVMMVGALALAGVPPFSGFWSKELIFHSLVESHNYALLAILMVTAGITMFYTFRMMGLAFFGKESHHVEHLIKEGHKPHDPSPIMWLPLVVLAGGSLVAGFLAPSLFGFFKPMFIPHGAEHAHLSLAKAASYAVHIEHYPVLTLPEMVVSSFASPVFLGSAVLLIIGFYAAWKYYIAYKASYEELLTKYVFLKKLWTFLYNRWYINAFYYKAFVNGTLALSNFVFKFIEAAGVGEALKKITVFAVDLLRRVQTGFLSFNMIYVALGLLAFASIVAFGGLPGGVV